MSNDVSVQNMTENKEASKTDFTTVETSARIMTDAVVGVDFAVESYREPESQVLIGTMGGGLAVSYYDHESKVNELNSLLDERIEECKGYFRKVKELERKLEETNQNCDGWFADVKSLRCQVDSKDQEIERLKEQIGNRVNELGIVEHTVENLIAEKSQFIDEIAKLKAEVLELRNEKDGTRLHLRQVNYNIALVNEKLCLTNKLYLQELSNLRKLVSISSLFFVALERDLPDVYNKVWDFLQNYEIQIDKEFHRIVGNFSNFPEREFEWETKERKK